MAVKNQALTICYTAWNTSTNAGQTGDAANHTLKVVQDGTEGNPTNGPSQVDATDMPGVYKLALTAADMNFNCVVLGGISSTANVVIIPLVIVTERGNINAGGNLPGAASGLALVGSNVGSASSVSGAVGSVTGNVGGNVVGSVASVTGAVGSVTGNVGGNVSGSVASVTGNVGGNVAGSVASVTGNVGGTVGYIVNAPFKINQNAGFEFAMVESTDHATPYTGGSVTAVRSIAGGAESDVSGTITQIGSTNRYYFAGLAADFNGTSVGFCFSAATADNVVVAVNTQP